MTKVYIKVSLDELETVEAMADSVKELAEICGVKVTSIYSMMCRAKRTGHRCQYRCVEIDDEE